MLWHCLIMLLRNPTISASRYIDDFFHEFPHFTDSRKMTLHCVSLDLHVSLTTYNIILPQRPKAPVKSQKHMLSIIFVNSAKLNA